MITESKFLRDAGVLDNLATSVAGALIFMQGQGGEWLASYDGEDYLLAATKDGITVSDPSEEEPLFTITWPSLFRNLGYPSRPAVDYAALEHY